MFTENRENNEKLLKVLTQKQCVHFCVHVAKFAMPIWEHHNPKNETLKIAIEEVENCLKLNKITRTACLLNKKVRNCYHGIEVYLQDNNSNNYSPCFSAITVNLAIKIAFHAISQLPNTQLRLKRVLENTEDCIHYAIRSLVDEKIIENLYNSIHKNKQFPIKWKTLNAQNIAKTILKENNFNDMSILADALEDSGCDDTEVLSHLRYNKYLWTPADWVLTNLTE